LQIVYFAIRILIGDCPTLNLPVLTMVRPMKSSDRELRIRSRQDAA